MRRAAAGLNGASGDRSFASAFAELFSDPEGARAVGRRYLALHPEEADPQGLAAGLMLDGRASSPARMRSRLAVQRRRDFAAGRTVLLEGWIVAQSEARACALLAVLPRG